MPRATTRAELINAANYNFDMMWTMIDSIIRVRQDTDFCYDAEALTAKDGAAHWKRDKNLRDMLVHLYEWHQLLLLWVESGEKGERKSFLPQGITWANYQKMNMDFWEKHQNTPYEKSKQMLKSSHTEVLTMTERYEDEELFKNFPFGLTAKSSIAEYCRAATVSHYDWAIKKLKEQMKALKNK